MGLEVLITAAFTQLASYLDPESVAFQQALQGSQDELLHNLLMQFLFFRSQGL